MEHIGKKLRKLREERGLSRKKLAEMLQISEYTIRDWETGRNRIKPDTISVIAEKLNVFPSYFFEFDYSEVDKSKMIPILGVIRAGEPILAQENIIGFIKPPEGIRADFALKVTGDSMIPYYPEGSLVYICQQPVVEQGEVAAVLIEQEDATLKKVNYKNGEIILTSFNPNYDPMTYKPEQVSIIGRVVYPLAANIKLGGFLSI